MTTDDHVSVSIRSPGTISEITAICRDIPLRRPFRFASYELKSLPYAWVRVRSSEGLVGYGECPTYWDPSGETQWAAVGAIRHLTPTLLGREVDDVAGIMRAIDKEAYGSFAAKCGIDAALYDITGQCLGVPVYRLLGGTAEVVRVNGVIGLPSVTETPGREDRLAGALASAEKQFGEGYRTLKLKVGLDLQFECELLEQISRISPPGATLFVDANQAWGDAKSAIRAVRRLEQAGAEWVEQPVRAYDLAGLRRVRVAVGASVIADEALYSAVDALRILTMEAADMFNIKLAKSGGMWGGGQVVAIARAGNVPCLLGSMVESGLGMLANYHFARAHAMATCGLSVYQDVDDGLDVGLRIEHGELLKREELPGLGYPDAAELEKAFQEAG